MGSERRDREITQRKRCSWNREFLGKEQLDWLKGEDSENLEADKTGS